MKKTIASILFSLTLLVSVAQVPKKVIVEHFTNTLCSICAARNPGFYTNLASQNPSNVLHIAIHPSSPYPACQLNLHNKPENDARTNYYGVYGGTPRLVIQGVVIPSSADYNSSALFAPYLGQTSPASVKVSHQKFNSDSIKVRVVIKTEATHSLGNLRLFVALAEDTLNYSAPNGETLHHDVFRKSFTGTSGIQMNLPAQVGDSVVYVAASTVSSVWNLARIYPLAILQEEANKSVVQCGAALASSAAIITGLKQNISESLSLSIFPNPAENELAINVNSGLESELRVINQLGQEIYKTKFNGSFILNTTTYSSGVYLVKIASGNKSGTGRFVKN